MGGRPIKVEGETAFYSCIIGHTHRGIIQLQNMDMDMDVIRRTRGA